VVAALASPAILFGPPSAAQGPTSQGWTDCELFEDLPGGARLLFQSVVGPGAAPSPHVGWSSGPAGRIHLILNYGRRPAGAPAVGHVFYVARSEPQPTTEYKFVFDFNGSAQQATLPLGRGFGGGNASVSGNFDAHRDPDLMQGFGRAERVTASLYEGDQQIAQSTFELAPDRREAGLAAFARRVQANDPGVCRATSGPPLPVPPIPHR
jgi:hypothetical protein